MHDIAAAVVHAASPVAREDAPSLRRALNALEVLALSLPEKAAIGEKELELFARERALRAAGIDAKRRKAEP